jgi:hypothetical protein
VELCMAVELGLNADHAFPEVYQDFVGGCHFVFYVGLSAPLAAKAF